VVSSLAGVARVYLRTGLDTQRGACESRDQRLTNPDSLAVLAHGAITR
jgi:hypothetical protein